MYRFLVIALLLTVGCLSAQDTLAIADLDQQPRLRNEDVEGVFGKPDQEKLFLTSVYSRINHPIYARENGVCATIEVEYLIDTFGTVKVEKTRALTMEEEGATISGNAPFLMTSYVMNGANPPCQSQNEEVLAQGHRVLEAEARRVITELPRFTPGKKNGAKVVARDTRYFVFRLE